MQKKLRRQNTKFDTPIFYFKPYPRSAITEDVEKKGYTLPQTRIEWSKSGHLGLSGPWVTKEKERFFENFKFYLNLAHRPKKSSTMLPIKKVAEWKLQKDGFYLPKEKHMYELLAIAN